MVWSEGLPRRNKWIQMPGMMKEFSKNDYNGSKWYLEYFFILIELELHGNSTPAANFSGGRIDNVGTSGM